MSKITYSEYLEMARNPDVEDDVLLSFSIIERGEGGFDFTFKADPEKVLMTDDDSEFENAMKIGNGLSRFRRQLRFKRRTFFGSKLPIIVSEGDSWVQFPLLVREIVDQLEDDYLIWSVGSAGDTAQNMVYGRSEYMKALNKCKDDVRAFIFSAAGNDIIGQDPETNTAVLFNLVRDFNGDINDIKGHVNMDLFQEKITFLEKAYTKVINDIRAKSEFNNLPIIIHGYDYVFPYPWINDNRNPMHADNNEWLGKPLDERGIHDQKQRRNIIKYLIDRLYFMLDGIAGNSETTDIWVVDCRGAMPEVSDWIDEIHGTSDGFKKIASCFIPVLSKAINKYT